MRHPLFARYYAPEGTGSGSPAAVPPPPSASAPAAPPPTAPAAAVPPAGSPTLPASVGAPPVAAPSQFTYDEDRSAWMPPTDVDRRIADAVNPARADAERFRRMLEAGTGVTVPGREAPLPPAVVEARATLEKIYPGIGQFYAHMGYLSQIAQTLQGARVDPRALGHLPQVFTSTETQWRQHAFRALQPIHAGVAQDLGTQALTARQADAITQDFISWIEADHQRLARYENGDPKLGTEYLDDYRNNFIHPLSRTAAGGPPLAAGLPPAPRSGGAGAGAGASAAAAAARPKTLDEATDRAWAGFQAATAAGR